MIKNTLICEYCSKKYVNKKCFDHHVLMCRVSKSNSKYHIDTIEKITLDKTPTISELYKIIIDLNNKYERLQRDYNTIKHQVKLDQKKKPLEIIEWLNNNYKPDKTFETWFQNIVIDLDNIDIIFEKNYINGVAEIILNYVHTNNITNSNSNLVPIQAFVEKDGLYIYNNNENWDVIKFDEFDKILKIFNNKLLNVFKEWHNITQRKMTIDKFNEVYVKNLQCVIAGNITNFDKNIKIRNILYKNLKREFRNIC